MQYFKLKTRTSLCSSRKHFDNSRSLEHLYFNTTMSTEAMIIYPWLLRLIELPYSGFYW